MRRGEALGEELVYFFLGGGGVWVPSKTEDRVKNRFHKHGAGASDGELWSGSRICPPVPRVFG